MQAADIMTRDVITVTPDVPVHEIARLMVERDISTIPVLDAGARLVGIVTEGDLIVQQATVRFPRYLKFLDSVGNRNSTRLNFIIYPFRNFTEALPALASLD